MTRVHIRRVVRKRLLLFVGSSVLASGLAWGLQGALSNPVSLRPVPNRKQVAVRYVPGEMLLLRVLQDFSSYSGKPVLVQGDVPPDAALSLTTRVEKLTAKAASAILKENGYQLSVETYRGERVYWVQRPLKRVRRKGGLTPSDPSGGSLDNDNPETTTTPKGGTNRSRSNIVGERGSQLGSSPSGTVALYRRQDGQGTRYVVLFETDSSKVADDVLSLLEAHQKSSTTASTKR